MAQAQEVNLPEPFITSSITSLPPQIVTPTQSQTQTQPTIPFRERVQNVLNAYSTDEVALKRELRRLLVPRRGEKTPKPIQNTQQNTQTTQNPW